MFVVSEARKTTLRLVVKNGVVCSDLYITTEGLITAPTLYQNNLDLHKFLHLLWPKNLRSFGSYVLLVTVNLFNNEGLGNPELNP